MRDVCVWFSLIFCPEKQPNGARSTATCDIPFVGIADYHIRTYNGIWVRVRVNEMNGSSLGFVLYLFLSFSLVRHLVCAGYRPASSSISPLRMATTSTVLSDPTASAASPHASTSIDTSSTPELQVNGQPATASPSSLAPQISFSSSANTSSSSQVGDGWGAHFWVTLVDPQVPSLLPLFILSFIFTTFYPRTHQQTGVSFYACPSTGEVSWDPPVGNFLCVSITPTL